MSNFRLVDRQTGFLLPPSVDDWLPERHLARYVVEVIDQLDTRAMQHAYRGTGSASYHPTMLLGLLVYGYATGVHSSRKIERATYDAWPRHKADRYTPYGSRPRNRCSGSLNRSWDSGSSRSAGMRRSGASGIW